MRQKIFLLFAMLLALTTQAWAAEGITCSASDVGKVLCTDGSIYDNVSAAEAAGKTAVAMIAYLDTVSNKGLALALANESGTKTWASAKTACSYKNTSTPIANASWMLPSKAQWTTMISAAGSYTALRDGFSSVGGINLQSLIYWSSTEEDNSTYAWVYSFRGGSWYRSKKTSYDYYVRACLAFDIAALTYPVKMADNWNVVYWRTQTKQSDWTALSAGSTTGRTLGSADAVTYYYASDNLSFTNSTAGGSGLKIQGTVYLYIPSGTTLTCTGANADGRTGAGAGIELTAGNTLYLIGSGTLNATGGNAANGGNGGKGNDAEVTYDESILGGSGGTGGNGGGGAGAGIGTRGGNGGTGGSGGQRNGSYGQETTQYGVDGSAGTAGGTAGAMGTLYGYQALAPTVNVGGGSKGASGSGGSRGKTASQHPGSNVYMASGGGGGGAGGFGGAASNIGTGGPGGGGGGGGAAGNVAWVVYSGTANGYYHAGAYGGAGGKNADGTSAPDGADVELDNPKHADIEGGGLRDKDTDYDDDDGWEDGNGRHPGGAGGAAGSASVGGSYGTVTLDWTTQGKGTEDDPFIVSSTDDWNEFADYVNNGISLSGKFVKLTADIDISTMAGAGDVNSFQGTFDGDGHTLTFTQGTSAEPFAEEYCAPFRHVLNAVIKNLHVAGTIYTSQKKAAGIVGISHQNLSITGCRSSISIVSSTVTGDDNHDGIHGGFVGTLSGENNTVTIDGCVFDGSFATTNSTINCGGFIGWVTYNTPTITNSLMAPTSVGAGMVANTFSRWHTSYEPTITNCYYVATTNLPTDQGTQAYALATAPANLGDAVENGNYGFVTAYQNGILYGGKYYMAPATISLADNSDNGTTISDANGYFVDVTLTDRTLYKDGAWNTICLPFNVTLSGSPLEDAVARPLESASISGSTLSLSFGNAVTTLQAGTPYIIKWESGDNLVSPVFSGVTIDATDRSYDNSASGDLRVRFMGTYKSTEFDAEDKSILLMGGENMLFYPATGAGLGAQRAYFKIGDDGAAGARLKAFRINFGDDETSGILSLPKDSRSAGESWFTLDGRRLSAKPSRAGVYINNGIKVVIK